MTTTSDDRPLDAPARLAALEALGLGRPEDSFDRASRLASRAMAAPVALVSIVTDDRQVFAAGTGSPSRGRPRAKPRCPTRSASTWCCPGTSWRSRTPTMTTASAATGRSRTSV